MVKPHQPAPPFIPPKNLKKKEDYSNDVSSISTHYSKKINGDYEPTPRVSPRSTSQLPPSMDLRESADNRVIQGRDKTESVYFCMTKNTRDGMRIPLLHFQDGNKRLIEIKKQKKKTFSSCGTLHHSRSHLDRP